MAGSVQKTITFIEDDLPKLKAGEYKIHVELSAGIHGKPVVYPADRGFAVAGLRFKLGGGDLASVFPPDLANGEYDGVLPHAVLNTPILPWLRTSVAHQEKAPWLAVLTLEEGELPPLPGTTSPIQALTAADLIRQDKQIEIAGAAPLSPPQHGKLPTEFVSYPGLENLDYGESPADPVNVVDLPVALFSSIVPTVDDLPILAHIRETDTYDSVDDKDIVVTRSIVLGNRVGKVGGTATALLVSLENMGPYLPGDDGTPSSQLAGVTTVRLSVLASWRFFVNAGDRALAKLLENLNAGTGLTSLRLPAADDSGQVGQAIKDEGAGIGPTDADALVANALAAGFVPLDHHLREAGRTVSWYRGPFLPMGPAASHLAPPFNGPDSLLRYDPLVGMFDTSYAAAWQLGQLMALRSRGYSVALYRWKGEVDKAVALAEELALLAKKLKPIDDPDAAPALAGFLAHGQARLAAGPPEPAAAVIDFIGGLRLLKGLPFAYLVPDERMLPPESLRLFSVDPDWIEALVDGAFSIGRASASQLAKDAAHVGTMTPLSWTAARAARTNDRPHLAALKAAAASSVPQMSGLLIRSAAVRGWPKLQIDGYSTADDSSPPDVPKLRMEHLSADVLLCLFDGPVRMVSIHEPPEQLHSGLEYDNQGAASTTLRYVTGDTPGEQTDLTAPIALRADKLTLKAKTSAASIQSVLNAPPLSQGVDPMTACEFALEMVKGVLRVEFAFPAEGA
jgi:hypothetical protein